MVDGVVVNGLDPLGNLLERPASAGEQHLSRFSKKKIIAVTGGAGFLGSHLCDALVTQGHKVVCIDNFYTGRRANIEHLADTKRFRFVEHDVTKPLSPKLPRFDEIYNLACPASPKHYQSDPVKTAMVCAMGTLHVLQRAARDQSRVFQASTSEVYGDPQLHPQPESYCGNVSTTGPRSCYDEGKRFAETLFTDYGRQFGLDFRIVRIFNTYGPRMRSDDGRVVSNFIVQALSDNDITVYGDGSQTRSFCYVDDLIDGLLRLMSPDGKDAGPVNIGNPVEITMSELAKTVLEMTGSSSKIIYRPLPTDDPRRRCPDISKAEATLGWAPTTSLQAGLSKTISYFSSQFPSDKKVSAPRMERVPTEAKRFNEGVKQSH